MTSYTLGADSAKPTNEIAAAALPDPAVASPEHTNV